MSTADSIIQLENHVRATTEVLRDAKGMLSQDGPVRWHHPNYNYWGTFTVNVDVLRRRATEFLKVATQSYPYAPRFALEDLVEQFELTTAALDAGPKVCTGNPREREAALLLVQKARQSAYHMFVKLVEVERNFIATQQPTVLGA